MVIFHSFSYVYQRVSNGYPQDVPFEPHPEECSSNAPVARRDDSCQKRPTSRGQPSKKPGKTEIKWMNMWFLMCFIHQKYIYIDISSKEICFFIHQIYHPKKNSLWVSWKIEMERNHVSQGDKLGVLHLANSRLNFTTCSKFQN